LRIGIHPDEIPFLLLLVLSFSLSSFAFSFSVPVSLSLFSPSPFRACSRVCALSHVLQCRYNIESQAMGKGKRRTRTLSFLQLPFLPLSLSFFLSSFSLFLPFFLSPPSFLCLSLSFLSIVVRVGYCEPKLCGSEYTRTRSLSFLLQLFFLALSLSLFSSLFLLSRARALSLSLSSGFLFLYPFLSPSQVFR